MDNVYAYNYKMYCLTATWLNDTILNHNHFPASYSVFHADRDYSNPHITRGGGVTVADSNLLQGVMRR
jgi:hypothetical protein